jgi:hypothetical protein
MLSNLFFIYILALQDNKYFVTELSHDKGQMVESFITNTNTTDMYSFFGKGYKWLELYPIVKIDNIVKGRIVNCNEIVKHYMANYGAHQVRGCDYLDVAYNENDFKEIVDDLNKNYSRDNLEGFEYEEDNDNEHYINQCSIDTDNDECI